MPVKTVISVDYSIAARLTKAPPFRSLHVQDRELPLHCSSTLFESSNLCNCLME
jgi:hypothetical protein